MLIRSLILTALLMAVINFTNAQQALPVKNLATYLEELASLGFDNFDDIDLIEEVAELEANPVNINSSTRSDLDRLFFLSSFQLESIINYIRQNGPLISVYELEYIPGFDKDLARLVSTYISLEKTGKSIYRRKRTDLNSSLIFSNRDTLDYPGSRLKTSTRFSHSSGRIKFGFTFEKDKGETFLYKGYYPEYLSGYLQISDAGPFSKIIAGDFRVRFGQGLTVWHGYSPGTSALNPNPLRGSSRISPYTSTDENNFFRGLAMSGRLGQMNYHMYFSSNMIDGTLAFDADSCSYISSLYDNGIHNTNSSINKRNTLNEISYGLNINQNFGRIFLGISFSGSSFSKEISPIKKVETLYDFRGSNNISLAIDHAASFNKLYLYGETAVNKDGNLATLQGLRLLPHERVKLNILYAHISRAYTSFHGHTFGKETINNFRRSFLSNIIMDIAPNTSLSAGALIHSDLWFGYRSGSFPRSIRYKTEVIYQGFEYLTLKASAWHRESLKDQSVDTGIETAAALKTNSARFHLDIYPLPSLSLASRFEFIINPENQEKGLLAYQALKFKPTNLPLSLILRYYTYSSGSYDTRIYAWEDDLLYMPSVPAFYGAGSRSYLVIEYSLKEKVSLRVKVASSDFKNKDARVSFSEYRMQLRVRI